jgi:hypothetical protein
VFTIAGAQFEGSLPGFGIQVGNIVGIAATADNQGYWLAGSDGGIFSFGDAPFFGRPPPGSSPVVGIVATSDGRGLWVAEKNGSVFAYGDAPSFGGLPDFRQSVNNIVALMPTPSGKGYWLIGSDGGVFTFGDAPFHGSLGALRLAQPIVGAIWTP